MALGRGLRGFIQDPASELPRIYLLGTWVNSDGHRAHCVILSGCSRAPRTRIRSWLSATCSAGDCMSVLVAMLIVSPSVRRGRLRGLRRRRLARSDQLRAVRLVLLRGRGDQAGRGAHELAQLPVLFTSAPIFASSTAVNSFSAKEVGHMAPSSRFASSLKPSVAYLESNFSALWKKQTTLPSLAYAGIP